MVKVAAFGPVHKRLWGKASLEKMFPWSEYIVRFGWCPDGKRFVISRVYNCDRVVPLQIIHIYYCLQNSQHMGAITGPGTTTHSSCENSCNELHDSNGI